MEQNQAIVHKKGQATLLMILGVFLILGIGVFFFWDNVDVYISEEIGRSEEEKDQYETLQECLSYYTEQGLKKIEAQGGYITLGRDAIQVYNESIGIFSQEGEQKVSLEDIEKDLADYIAMQTKENCFQESNKYEIDKLEDPKAEAEFLSDSLVLTMDWPLRFRSKENPTEIFTISTAAEEIQTHFMSLFEVAEVVSQNEGNIDYQQEYFSNQEVNLTLFSYEEQTIVLLGKEEEFFIIAIGN